MKVNLPLAIMIDLDDTIIAFEVIQAECWNRTLGEFAESVAEIGNDRLAAQIQSESGVFWSDPERHRVWRQNLELARRRIVRKSFRNLGMSNESLADKIADRYNVLREEAIYPFPGAIETIRKFREMKLRLALVTNGSSASQRRKIDRFGIAPLFDHILIEGEQGFGKPDERIYLKALSELGTLPSETWMIGDNPVWDVAAPQSLGIRGIWVNSKKSREKPDPEPYLTLGSLSEIINYL